MRTSIGRIVTGLCIFLFISCTPGRKPSVYFHDNHKFSYAPIVEYSREYSAVDLILLDYHHDSAPGPSASEMKTIKSLRGYNWLGRLLLEGAVRKVYWVSGNDLEQPNLEARKAWLERHLNRDSPQALQIKRGRVDVLTWETLQEMSWEKSDLPVIISLDLDVLVTDPGPDPELFLYELLEYINCVNPDVVTVALSSVYQPLAQDAWFYFRKSYENLSKGRAVYLNGGEISPVSESLEEMKAWEKWSHQKISPDFGKGFSPGMALWNHAPASFWQALIFNPPEAQDMSSQVLIELLEDSMMRKDSLSKNFSDRELNRFFRWVRTKFLEAVENIPQQPVILEPSDEGKNGVAVRFISETNDRGCFAYTRGVSDMKVAMENCTVHAAFYDPRYPDITGDELHSLMGEITVFGTWQAMDSPLDYIPGIDALCLERNNDTTLLQPSIAIERDLSRIQFLQTLNRKAGYDPDSWDNAECRYFKAPAVFIKKSLLEER